MKSEVFPVMQTSRQLKNRKKEMSATLCAFYVSSFCVLNVLINHYLVASTLQNQQCYTKY